ncbi:MAG TPA: hypothetical protein VK691_01415 [Solirubrobacteraceae bacterium]|jgi:hypothetical protein|nr:hypothetical protein [Solirubrobacteraceae bacterium]
MRIAGTFAVVLVAALCSAGGASAAPAVKLKVAFDPNVTGERTTIELGLSISGPKGGQSVPVTSLDLRLPAQMGLGSSSLGQANCEPASLIADGLGGCPGNARVGLGNATAVVPVGLGLVHEMASLDVLLGPPGEDRVELLFYVQALRPVFGALILPSVVEEDALPYGDSLETSVPLVEAWPEGPDLALQTFNASLGPKGLTYHGQVRGKTVAYHPSGIRVPPLCPRGGYPFGALLTFADGTHSAAVYHVPCPPRTGRS